MTGQGGITFRPAEAADLPRILALIADDSLGRTREEVGEAIDPAYLRAFDAIKADPNQLFAVAEHAAGVIGCMQITFIPGLSRRGAWRGQLESVRIAAPLRGKGLGAAFFRWAFDQCRARGCTLVQLTTDKTRADALRFYERLGFEASHNGMKLPL